MMRTLRPRPDIWPGWWRRRLWTVVIGVGLLAVLVVARLRLPGGSDHARYHQKRFTCVNVVDGDTIDINLPDGKYPSTRIRLWGVDTPETGHSPQGAMFFGDEASAFTRSLVLDKPVRLLLAPDRTRGKYGRLLAYVTLDGGETMLNEEIIRRGFGYADSRFDHVWKQRFVTIEQRARKQQLGLWQQVTLEQMPAWRQRYEQWRADNAD